MSYKRKMGHGLAFDPERDMHLFRKMAKQGYHLCGLDITGRYKFEKGEEKDYIFSYTAAKNPDEDYIAYFIDAGWKPVLLYPNLQIFRAIPGTDPLYTDRETLTDFYKEEVQRYLKYSTGTTFLFILCSYIAFNFLRGVLGLFLFITGLFPFVFTVMPLFGFLYHYKRQKKVI